MFSPKREKKNKWGKKRKLVKSVDWTTDLLNLRKKNWFLSGSVLKIVSPVPHPNTNIALLPPPLCLLFFHWMSWSDSKLQIRTHLILALYPPCCKMLLLYISETIVRFQTPTKCQEAPGLSMLSLCTFAARRGTHGSHPVLPPRSIWSKASESTCRTGLCWLTWGRTVRKGTWVGCCHKQEPFVTGYLNQLMWCKGRLGPPPAWNWHRRVSQGGMCLVLCGWNMHVVWETWLQRSLVSVLPHHGHKWPCPLLVFWDVSVQQESLAALGTWRTRPALVWGCCFHCELKLTLCWIYLWDFFFFSLPPGLLCRMQLWILCLF